MYIDSGNVYDEETESTKTSTARTVLLSEAALEALRRQKAHTFLIGEHVFHAPKTGAPCVIRQKKANSGASLTLEASTTP
jgi:integrase